MPGTDAPVARVGDAERMRGRSGATKTIRSRRSCCCRGDGKGCRAVRTIDASAALRVGYCVALRVFRCSDLAPRPDAEASPRNDGKDVRGTVDHEAEGEDGKRSASDRLKRFNVRGPHEQRGGKEQRGHGRREGDDEHCDDRGSFLDEQRLRMRGWVRGEETERGGGVQREQRAAVAAASSRTPTCSTVIMSIVRTQAAKSIAATLHSVVRAGVACSCRARQLSASRKYDDAELPLPCDHPPPRLSSGIQFSGAATARRSIWNTDAHIIMYVTSMLPPLAAACTPSLSSATLSARSALRVASA